MKKVYKTSISARIIFVAFSLLIIIFELIFPEKEIPQRLISLFLIVFFMLGAFLLSKIRIIINEDGIMFGGQKTNYLKWNEIGELNSIYVLFPESPIITLKPRKGLAKKPIEFMMFGMTLELLKDIISHLSPDAKIHLYTRLKRQLEGKQVWFYRE